MFYDNFIVRLFECLLDSATITWLVILFTRRYKNELWYRMARSFCQRHDLQYISIHFRLFRTIVYISDHKLENN